ncbi:MAG: polysaccharide deacetylase family protein [bacterium]|nr:polysaccharide deacetylase family protein [bacterium]
MRFILLTKKQVLGLTAVMIAIIITTAVSLTVFASSSKLLPIYNVSTESKKIAISFDAAWGNDDTQTLIDTLAEYGVVATFFVVGDWVDKYPESVKQLSDAGHQIQNHSDSHPHMTNLSTNEMITELKNCNEKIAKITGKTPTLHRCPYGDYNNNVIEAIQSIGMYAIQWDVDSLDWKENATAESIANRVISKTKNGSIILMHNDADHTPEALPTILKTLKEQGYEFVFIEDLIYKENYEILHDGTQCKIEN